MVFATVYAPNIIAMQSCKVFILYLIFRIASIIINYAINRISLAQSLPAGVLTRKQIRIV